MTAPQDVAEVVKRLRDMNACADGCHGRCKDCPNEIAADAATLITKLSEEKARLERVADAAEVYFNGYVQDEAEDSEWCINEKHHQDAKELEAAIRARGSST